MPPGSSLAVSVKSRHRTPSLRGVIQRALRAAARAEELPAGLSVAVLVTDDDEIRQLNVGYAGEDHATDVLSFAAGENGLPGEDGVLGDIVLSLYHLRVQAAAASHSLERETAVLTVHGFLHLLGYDHAEPAEERAMFNRTDEIVATLGELG
ncbi:MAG: rRNA maturation RNase YbeY [Candidatus Dormibacteria bacterium]